MNSYMAMMGISLLFLVLSVLPTSLSSSIAFDGLRGGSSLSVEKSDHVLISPNGIFSAGFFVVGKNAFCFSIWFTKSSHPTVVWMANRDKPVNGRGSKLSLLKNGNLILTDAGQIKIWSTDTASASLVQLQLHNNGNLVLGNLENITLWESFKSPTDTLLPDQPLTKDTSLISSRSRGNYSSGYYKLYFDNDNVIRLLYNGPEITSVYWPEPGLNIWSVIGRNTFDSRRYAAFNSSGFFWSTDALIFFSADYGTGPLRRLTIDSDGNLRMYSLEQTNWTWAVSWQTIFHTCRIHGICGANSTCSYDHVIGRRCSCLPGYKMKNPVDWSYGCEPEFSLSSIQSDEVNFFRLSHVEFYGYEATFKFNYTLRSCQEECLELRESCKGFQYKFDQGNGVYFCYTKKQLLNGHYSPNFDGDLYLKLPKDGLSYRWPLNQFPVLDCSSEFPVQLNRTYEEDHENGTLKVLLWFASAIGVMEVTCIFLVWFLLFRTNQDCEDPAVQGYLVAATAFRKFTYAELKKAAQGFREEIGRGGGGVVYKGILPDERVIAIKRLNEANQGEAEFLAEVSTIGRFNHMNLIKLWGYCAEGKHRLLVYEYMEHGSLADNLSSHSLSWEKRFKIATGTAKCLAYLHEECLDWILHCDIKPENILLDSDYQPKVADFGPSKLLKRGNPNSSFSRIRGTRGYMAPEWVYNLPITSKVDVYSYGVVMLEMLTGKSPTVAPSESREIAENGRLVAWVREKKNGVATKGEWIEEIVNPILGTEYEVDQMDIFVTVALSCVEEDSDARPTMRQVVEMLCVSLK